jgi:hypothetical protein
MTFEIAERQTLRHNPLNAVTASVERVIDSDGNTLIRKELTAPEGTAPADPRWAASTDSRHWNYWRREAEVYRSVELRDSLRATGLDLPAATVEVTDTGAVLWLEDVAGTPGTEFELDDHVAVAAALGRWQAAGPLELGWESLRFIEQYSGSRPNPVQLLDDDRAWSQPLIAQSWPPALRAGWQRLVANRPLLLDIMRRLPRTRCHLDVWVSNQIRRPSGEIVLLDWAFAGDGALGEDLGNHIPDATLDLFWPAERLAELDDACFGAYLGGLRAAGWHGEDSLVRLGITASCVKYSWLLPGMLQRAAATEHAAYHRAVDPFQLYQQRGLILSHLVAWCDEALSLAHLLS